MTSATDTMSRASTLCITAKGKQRILKNLRATDLYISIISTNGSSAFDALGELLRLITNIGDGILAPDTRPLTEMLRAGMPGAMLSVLRTFLLLLLTLSLRTLPCLRAPALCSHNMLLMLTLTLCSIILGCVVRIAFKVLCFHLAGARTFR